MLSSLPFLHILFVRLTAFFCWLCLHLPDLIPLHAQFSYSIIHIFLIHLFLTHFSVSRVSIYLVSGFFPFLLWWRNCLRITLLEPLAGLMWQSIHFLFKLKDGTLCALFFPSQPCRANDKHQETFLSCGLVGSDFALPTGGVVAVNTSICRSSAKRGACFLWLLPGSRRQTLPAF